jgi:DNA-binding transcriptional LysR family regulator
MNIRALRLFRQIVTSGSLAAAAEGLGMSTSAASRLIGLLEIETRLTLFNRSHRRLALTTQGERFYRESEHILAGFDEIPRIVANIRSRSPSQLRLVTGPRIGQGLVSPALARFPKRHRAVQVSVDMDSRFGIEGSMGTRLYDIGIVSLPVSHPMVALDNHPLFRVRVEAVLPANHRLAARRGLTAEDLAQEPLIGLWPGQRWRRQVDDFFGAGGVRPTYAVETRSSLMACQLARDGAGIAFLDRVCAQALNLRGLVLRPLEPERWLLFGYVHQARHPPSALATTFVECVRETLLAFVEASEANARAVVIAD